MVRNVGESLSSSRFRAGQNARERGPDLRSAVRAAGRGDDYGNPSLTRSLPQSQCDPHCWGRWAVPGGLLVAYPRISAIALILL